MPSPAVKAEFGVWMTDEHPNRIEFLPRIVEEICGAAVEGLCKFRRGGLEIGGVLFGNRLGDVIRIVAFRPAACEHAFGPSFTFSDNDGLNLLKLLVSAERDPALRGLEPLGWYHSHTRSEVCLSEEDLEIYNRYFPHPWQVAMVVRPAHFGPARVGFFFREPDGSVQAAASYREFTVRPAEVASAGQSEQHPNGKNAPIPDGATAVPPDAPGPHGAELPAMGPPLFSAGRRRASRKWMWVAAVLLLTVAAALIGARNVASHSTPASLGLRVMDVDGQLLIEWDRSTASVREASGALIEITDGGDVFKIEMDAARLSEGSVTYKRQSERVDIRFQVDQSGAEPVRELIRFLGPPASGKASAGEVEAIHQRDALQGELNRVRAELEQLKRLQQRPAPR
jgi:proteasome lid subunit RPN8/RPN11